ncbi:MAG: hypothetical protein RLZZ546_2728, partial [Bacteroidota bacterium]
MSSTNNTISHKEVLGVKQGDTDIDIIRKYKKKLKVARNDYEKSILFDSYQKCIQEISPNAFDTSNIKSHEELKKLNDEIENNPHLQDTIFGPKKRANLFNSNEYLDNQQLEKIRNECGKDKSLNIDKFNNIFDQIYSKQNTKPVHYDEVKSFDVSDNFTGQFQSVASYGNILTHMGEYTHDDFNKRSTKRKRLDINDISDNYSRPSHDTEYSFNNYIVPGEKITNDQMFADKQRRDLMQKSEINKAFIAMNANRTGRQINLDDRENQKIIDNIIEARMRTNSS